MWFIIPEWKYKALVVNGLIAHSSIHKQRFFFRDCNMFLTHWVLSSHKKNKRILNSFEIFLFSSIVTIYFFANGPIYFTKVDKYELRWVWVRWDVLSVILALFDSQTHVPDAKLELTSRELEYNSNILVTSNYTLMLRLDYVRLDQQLYCLFAYIYKYFKLVWVEFEHE